MDEAFDFLKSLDRAHYEKILFNIRKVQVDQNSTLLKKLNKDIWEFRTLYQGVQYRLLAFWDKSDVKLTLVVSTHGFIKKTDKIPSYHIKKAYALKNRYFNNRMNEGQNKDKNTHP